MVSFDIANNWDDFPEIQQDDIEWEEFEGASDFIVYRACVGSNQWAIRCNDFPDEPLYTLLINDETVIHFDDWPDFWKKPSEGKQEN